MAEATATTTPDPAAIAALKHVGLVGGLTETKVSCAALGDRLDASTQTASRRLQTLESAGYIERDVVGDGQWVRLTDAGEAALRAEYADYRRLFESDVGLALRGTVTGGMGEGRHYITLPGYAEQFRDRLEGVEGRVGRVSVLHVTPDEGVQLVGACDNLAVALLEQLRGDVEPDLRGFHRDRGVEAAVGDVVEQREVGVGVGAGVRRVVVMLAEEVQDDRDTVFVARSRVVERLRHALAGDESPGDRGDHTVI